ncbi:hypothetical protein ACLEC2_17480, partial [Lonsdalea quercina]|uniref:hypothetical protein n=1 Tax=Lonsdalea quercina TaxID=71657 RepID=UPI0039761D71
MAINAHRDGRGESGAGHARVTAGLPKQPAGWRNGLTAGWSLFSFSPQRKNPQLALRVSTDLMPGSSLLSHGET